MEEIGSKPFTIINIISSLIFGDEDARRGVERVFVSPSSFPGEPMSEDERRETEAESLPPASVVRQFYGGRKWDYLV
jgi:hypothetical protein